MRRQIIRVEPLSTHLEWYQWRHWCQASLPPSRDVAPAEPVAPTSGGCDEPRAKNELTGMLQFIGPRAGRPGQPGSWQPVPAGRQAVGGSRPASRRLNRSVGTVGSAR